MKEGRLVTTCFTGTVASASLLAAIKIGQIQASCDDDDDDDDIQLTSSVHQITTVQL